MAEEQAIKDLFGSDSEEEELENKTFVQSEQDLENKKEQRIDEARTEDEIQEGTNSGEQLQDTEPVHDQLKELFGSDEEDEDDDKTFKERDIGLDDRNGFTEEERVVRGEYEEVEDEETKAKNHRRDDDYGPPMEVSAQLLDTPNMASLRVAKLSNILAIETEPYDPETFQPTQVEYIDDRGQKRVRLSDANAIRWRWVAGPDGGLIRESNARIVEWSDGSKTLSVGDEYFDVRDIDISDEQSFLYARIPNLIQAQGRLTNKWVFRPASLTSGTHKRLASVLDRHSTKQQRVRATTTLVDPKKEKEEREREEEERIRYKERLIEKQTKQLRKYTSSARKGTGIYGRHTALSAAYLEEEDDDLDDGFIVKDVDEDEDEDEDYDAQDEEQMEGSLDEDENISDDEGEHLDRRTDMDDEAAAQRLAAAKTLSPVPTVVSTGKRILADSESDDEDIEDEENIDEMKKAKKKRAIVMESESD